jgi:hypothetical protein
LNYKIGILNVKRCKRLFHIVVPFGNENNQNKIKNIEIDNEYYLIDVFKDYFLDSANINNL